MNRRQAQVLRLKQLMLIVQPEMSLGQIQRPMGGWLRAIRQALGLSLNTVGKQLGLTPQAIHSLEKSEAVSSISLRQLENVANAMGCRVVYLLVPVTGTLQEMADKDNDSILSSVEHSMALEGQAVERPKNGR